MALTALLTALSIVTGSSCAAVDPVKNEALWTRSGTIQQATYADRGRLVWSRSDVPQYVRAAASSGTGRAVRIRCLTRP